MESVQAIIAGIKSIYFHEIFLTDIFGNVIHSAGPENLKMSRQKNS